MSSRHALLDAAERTFWTAVVVFLTNLTAAQMFDADIPATLLALEAAVGSVIQVVLLYGRRRLAVLPDPGAGLPGLPNP